MNNTNQSKKKQALWQNANALISPKSLRGLHKGINNISILVITLDYKQTNTLTYNQSPITNFQLRVSVL